MSVFVILLRYIFRHIFEIIILRLLLYIFKNYKKYWNIINFIDV